MFATVIAISAISTVTNFSNKVLSTVTTVTKYRNDCNEMTLKESECRDVQVHQDITGDSHKQSYKIKSKKSYISTLLNT